MAETILSASDSQEVRICLLISNCSRDLGAKIEALLLAYDNALFKLKLQRIEAYISNQSTQSIGPCLTRLDPHIILVVISFDNQQSAGKLIQTAAMQSQKPVLAVLKTKKPEVLIKLIKLGVTDFIVPPFEEVNILPRLWRLAHSAGYRDNVCAKLKAKIGLGKIIGRDPGFLAEIGKIPTIAACDAGVLILGETGTGKEMCARAIHYLGHRSEKPFVPVNCGAIPSELVENELFGHVKGAYTGAAKSSLGLISAADGGTLFLDEIDCLPLSAQSKLMRLLQDKEYRQLGSTSVKEADVRFVAASNLDLFKAVEEGNFRRDLYYRLNVIPLNLPRLRDRRDDIVLLARYFLKRYVKEHNKQIADFSPQAIQNLLLHHWPGNVRELENLVQRAVIFSESNIIQADDISLTIDKKNKEVKKSFQEMKAKVVADFEKSYIQDLLHRHVGNISLAAKAARKNRRSFWELIRKHQIDVQKYKAGK